MLLIDLRHVGANLEELGDGPKKNKSRNGGVAKSLKVNYIGKSPEMHNMILRKFKFDQAYIQR